MTTLGGGVYLVASELTECRSHRWRSNAGGTSDPEGFWKTDFYIEIFNQKEFF